MKPADLKIVKKALRHVNSKVRKDVSVSGAVEIRTLTRHEGEVEVEQEEEFVFHQEVTEEVVEEDVYEDEVEGTDRM